MMQAGVVVLIGANPTVNHPIAATWVKNAIKNGTQLIVADPRRSDLARHATHFLQFKADTDVALLNAIMHAIIDEGLVDEGLVDEAFVADRTSGFDELARNVAAYRPEAMADARGIPAGWIRNVARLFATSHASMILWGMGISQHVHRTRNTRCLMALCMLTGQVGRSARHRIASAARPDQCAGRLGCRPRPRWSIRTASALTIATCTSASRRCGVVLLWIQNPGSPSSRSWTRCTPARLAACTSG